MKLYGYYFFMPIYGWMCLYSFVEKFKKIKYVISDRPHWRQLAKTFVKYICYY
jgi:hypothetical protein